MNAWIIDMEDYWVLVFAETRYKAHTTWVKECPSLSVAYRSTVRKAPADVQAFAKQYGKPGVFFDHLELPDGCPTIWIEEADNEGT